MVAGTRKTVRMPAVPVPRLSDGVVTVRGAREADIPDLVAACRDPEIPRWTRVPSPYTREDAARFLAVAATEAAAGEAVALAIAGADDDRFDRHDRPHGPGRRRRPRGDRLLDSRRRRAGAG